ncbi:MAG: hypothetical protein NXI22_05055 [bacterium]|nr:hypothetical protein [bacterium]
MKRTAGLICGLMIVALSINAQNVFAQGPYPGGPMPMGGPQGGYPPGGMAMNGGPMMGGPPGMGVPPGIGGPPGMGGEIYPEEGYITTQAGFGDGMVMSDSDFAASGPSGLQNAPMVSSMPGSLFIAGNLASRGLGYRNSYASMGAKLRLGEDFLRGRWTFEPRGGINLNDGQAFGSAGFERFQTINSAFADVSIAGFIDGDGDTQGTFGPQYMQLGLTAKVRRGKFLLQANGYIPIGDTGEFVNATTYDSAMQGADVFVGLPLPMHQMVNARLDLGGYYYGDADGFAPSFGGIKGRLNIVGHGGIHYNLEMNTDDVNGFTGVFQIVGVFGGHDSYSKYGNDLIRTLRNDHIVRIHRE